jgi:endonuclease YncB( thermonuclease family)
MLALPASVWIALVIVAAIAAFAHVVGLPWIGRVHRVVDGDSVEARAWRHLYRIRLHGVDAPEWRQDHGSEATEALRRLVDGRRVLFIPFGRDRYGRLPCRMITVRGPVSWWLALQGHAWPDSLITGLLHLPARILRRGLWSYHVRIRPADFRLNAERLGMNRQFKGKSRGPRRSSGSTVRNPRRA